MNKHKSISSAHGTLDFDLLKLKMQADYTLLSWVSVAVSMISFGFAVYAILERLKNGGATLPAENTPRNVGLFLIALGTTGIVMGMASYCHTLRQMRRQQYFGWLQPPLVSALAMVSLGLFLCTNIVMGIF